MDNDILTLTPELRDEMETALTDDINNRDSRTRVGSLSYLAILLGTEDGTNLAGHMLEDVVLYFGLVPDED